MGVCEDSVVQGEPREGESGLCSEPSGKALMSLKQEEWAMGYWAE